MVILIMGILFAIAMASWNSVIQSRRVDSAANQLASDMRLAHSSAVNQLTDWRVVVVLNRGDASIGPDYYLMKLNAPYDAGDPTPTAIEVIPRTFDGNVSANQTFNDQGSMGTWFISPESPTPASTLTFEFNSDGGSRIYAGVSGSVCVTVDGNPISRIYVQSATSRVVVRNVGC